MRYLKPDVQSDDKSDIMLCQGMLTMLLNLMWIYKKVLSAPNVSGIDDALTQCIN